MSSPEVTTVRRSCATCPALLRAGKEVTDFLKTDPGADICSIYGHVLSRAGISKGHQKKIQLDKAKSCPSYGSQRPEVPNPNNLRFEVALPNPDGMTYESTSYDRMQVKTCVECMWWIPPTEVKKKFGWAGGICSAKGKLIGGGRVEIEADRCDKKRRSYGYEPPVVDINGLVLLPELDETYAPKSDPLGAFRESQANFVDPVDYPTDQKVTDEDAEAGIRAWRAIEDVATGNVVHLPIYRTDHFTEDLQELIPRTNDDEHPELYLDYSGKAYPLAVLWMKLDVTPAVWGMAGVGKTELFRWMAWMMNLPFRRISITASSEIDDLVGKTLYQAGKGTYFQYGRLSKAWINPGVICIDEPNTGPPDVWQLLRPLTDDSKQLVLDQNNGERLIRHQDSYMGFAMNPAWDMRNTGAEELADADASRLMHLAIDLPPYEVEREIIKNRCLKDGFEIDDEMLNLVMGVSLDLRELSKTGALDSTWGTRNSVKCARLLAWLSPIDAYSVGVADFLDPDQREAVRSTVETHVKGS